MSWSKEDQWWAIASSSGPFFGPLVSEGSIGADGAVDKQKRAVDGNIEVHDYEHKRDWTRLSWYPGAVGVRYRAEATAIW